MQDIDRFLPDLRTYAASCPDPTAFRFIRDAAKEFCKATRLWREWDEFTVTTPEGEGIITYSDAILFEIEAAKFDGDALEPKTARWMDENVPDWSTDTETGTPRYITQITPNSVTIVPRATGTLRARLVLAPADDALTLPDLLMQHRVLIGKGAAGNALLVPNTDFTNPQLGAALIRMFQDELNTEAHRASKGQQKAPRRTKGDWL